MILEKQRLEEQIDSIRTQLEECPEGKIFCTQNGKYYKWYYCDGNKEIYIPKKDRKFAEKLAEKKYLSLRLEDLLQEKRAIDSYLRCHAPFPGKAEQLLSEKQAYQELLSSHFQILSDELLQWQNSPYKRNEKYPEQLIIKTGSGNKVRSKSEAMIDMVLHNHKIPFHYEEELKLGNVAIFPDFTIRHPVTGEIYYWEHFGMMDDPGYSQQAFSKMQLYAVHNIIPTMQLITTYETKARPLSSETIEKLVEDYFR